MSAVVDGQGKGGGKNKQTDGKKKEIFNYTSKLPRCVSQYCTSTTKAQSRRIASLNFQIILTSKITF